MSHAESQKSIDFHAAAFLGQNISAKVRKSRNFVLFEKNCVIFDFLYYFTLFLLKASNCYELNHYFFF